MFLLLLLIFVVFDARVFVYCCVTPLQYACFIGLRLPFETSVSDVDVVVVDDVDSHGGECNILLLPILSGIVLFALFKLILFLSRLRP